MGKSVYKDEEKSESIKTYFPHAPAGRVKGLLFAVFGGVGTVLTGGWSLFLLTLEAGFLMMGTALTLLAGSLLMIVSGMGSRIRIKRYRKYLGLFQGRDSCTIKELESYSGFSKDYLVKDLKKMIDVGIFPQGHIDEDKNLVMLSIASYDCFLIEQERRKLEEQKNGRTDSVDAGKDYILKVREYNALIEDEEVSSRIYRMEETISKIIGYIEEHPDQKQDVRRLMRYYLPTVLKLLNAYQEFERQPIQGENIQTARSEIKKALDNINAGFERLFDSFFIAASLDVSTEISVLETMLDREIKKEDDGNG